MTTSPLGIDISKRKFDACLVREGGKLRHRSFPNNADGFAQLSAWLTKYEAGPVHACLEATGAYGEALSTDLHEAGHIVSVINPAVIKAYGESHLEAFVALRATGWYDPMRRKQVVKGALAAVWLIASAGVMATGS